MALKGEIIPFCFTIVLLCFSISSAAQRLDEELFVQFKNQFDFLDSLIFKQQPLGQSSPLLEMQPDGRYAAYDTVDSLLYEKVEKQMKAMTAETG